MPYEVIKTDTLDQFSWLSKIITYDDNNVITDILATNDNGTISGLSFTHGVLTMSILSDGEGANSTGNWTTIIKSYDTVTGELRGKDTVYDDGTMRNEIFTNGQLTSTILLDSPERDGIYNWDQIVTTYDPAGQWRSTTTSYDNGVEKSVVDDQVKGIKAFIGEYDLDDTKSWSTIETEYDDAGGLASKTISYDSGLTMAYEYTDGSLTRVVKTDGEGVQSTAKWNRVETTYNEAGQRGSVTTTYDDGTVKLDRYSEGHIITTTMLDQNDTESWDEITTHYDENHNVFGRDTINDNGMVKLEHFFEGTRVSTSQLDNPGDAGNGVKDWRINSTHYNQDGSLHLNHMVLDNNDQFVFQYVEGSKVSKMDFDGDESHDWLLRVTEYTENGSVAEMHTYNSFEDVPEQYAESLSYIMNSGQVIGGGEGEGEGGFIPDLFL